MNRVSIDVGGTFTDCVVLDADGALGQYKAPTTPADPSVGLTNALAKAAAGHGQELGEFLEQVELIIQGTTLATNTLINRNGARTGFITTGGFRDIIEMRRGFKNVRTSMYNVFVPPYRPLVERYLRLEVEERMTYAGEVHTPLKEADVEAAAARLHDDGIEAVAIGFLHAYANPQHEQRASELTRAVMPEAYVTSSHEILPVWREYERFSTTVVSAYCGPIVERYLRSLEGRLREAGFRGQHLLMCSDGLVETIDYCIPRVVYLIGSGPAAAPAGALHVARDIGEDNILSVDMGGTSFDICMVRGGEIPTTTEAWVQDERVAIKMVDVQSGGAGGGSIAWIDQLGLLRVGPMSAGADPGPACYGRGGTQPTVTDADLVLGYVPADFFLGGEIELDADSALSAIASVAEPLGMDVPRAAEAIFKTVNSYMADQITEVATTTRLRHPRLHTRRRRRRGTGPCRLHRRPVAHSDRPHPPDRCNLLGVRHVRDGRRTELRALVHHPRRPAGSQPGAGPLRRNGAGGDRWDSPSWESPPTSSPSAARPTCGTSGSSTRSRSRSRAATWPTAQWRLRPTTSTRGTRRSIPSRCHGRESSS